MSGEVTGFVLVDLGIDCGRYLADHHLHIVRVEISASMESPGDPGVACSIHYVVTPGLSRAGTVDLNIHDIVPNFAPVVEVAPGLSRAGAVGQFDGGDSTPGISGPWIFAEPVRLLVFEVSTALGAAAPGVLGTLSIDLQDRDVRWGDTAEMPR